MLKARFWLALSLLALPLSASAGEGFFSRVYTTDTTPAGGMEVEQLVRNRSGRAYGSYTANDFYTEFEYGFTDNFQGAFYVNYGNLNAAGASDDDNPVVTGSPTLNRHTFYLQSYAFEMIYRVLSPVTSPVGLAFYLEPEYYFHDLHNGLRYDRTFSQEGRIILQKNLFDDTLILAYNLVAEVEFIRFEGQEGWRGELDFNHELGATYRVAPNWFVGWEARNHNELGDFSVHEHSVIWTGPSIHYGGERLWATLGALRQVYGDPSGVDPETGASIGDHHLFLRSHEKLEITAKVGIPF